MKEIIIREQSAQEINIYFQSGLFEDVFGKFKFAFGKFVFGA